MIRSTGTDRRLRRSATLAALVVALVVLVGSTTVLAQDAPNTPGPTLVRYSAPHDTWDNILQPIFFFLFAATTLLSALGICLTRSIVRMAVYLFFTLGSVAMLFFLLLADFIAVIQLIVYAGGTLILLVFGVMLTSKSPWARFDIKPKEMLAAGVVCVVFAAALLAVITTATWPHATDAAATGPTVAAFGETLLTTYLVPFEAVSVLLLAVMIGAAYLARQE
jgi:NADH-quinone oxidoreductase subunit J